MDKVLTQKRERNEELTTNNEKTKKPNNPKNKKSKDENQSNSNSDAEVVSDTDSEEFDFSNYQKNNPDKKLLSMPKKSKFRMRAHCNPLSDISIS